MSESEMGLRLKDIVSTAHTPISSVRRDVLAKKGLCNLPERKYSRFVES
jgi:hypothetical protein